MTARKRADVEALLNGTPAIPHSEIGICTLAPKRPRADVGICRACLEQGLFDALFAEDGAK